MSLQVPPIGMKQTTANRLAGLISDMEKTNELLAEGATSFQQSSCCYCVLGNAIQLKSLNGFSNPEKDFPLAYNWIFDNDCAAKNRYAAYLFESPTYVKKLGKELDLPTDYFTPDHAITRIKAVLDREGYDII